MEKETLKPEQLLKALKLEEFRYWDACRNNVPDKLLSDLKFRIEEMKYQILEAHAHV
jgi:hypothetical protein